MAIVRSQSAKSNDVIIYDLIKMTSIRQKWLPREKGVYNGIRNEMMLVLN